MNFTANYLLKMQLSFSQIIFAKKLLIFSKKANEEIRHRYILKILLPLSNSKSKHTYYPLLTHELSFTAVFSRMIHSQIIFEEIFFIKINK